MTRTLSLSTTLLLLALAGCDGADSPGRAAAEPAAAAAPRRYVRELIFLGEREGEPLVAPLVFRAADQDSLRRREIRGWLARGPAWEAFLKEEWEGRRVGSAWTMVPHGELHLAAGGAAGVESLWYRRGGRNLRLSLGAPVSGWDRGRHTRYRLFQGELRIGGDRTRGSILEVLEVVPPERAAAPETGVDQLLLTSGDSLRILVVDSDRPGAAGQELGWVADAEGQREWSEAEIRSLQGQALEEARRDIPLAWRFRLPEAGITGEVRAIGSAAEVGGERGGRRAVVVRSTVAGWIERGGERTPVVGVLRHTQG